MGRLVILLILLDHFVDGFALFLELIVSGVGIFAAHTAELFQHERHRRRQHAQQTTSRQRVTSQHTIHSKRYTTVIALRLRLSSQRSVYPRESKHHFHTFLLEQFYTIYVV